MSRKIKFTTRGETRLPAAVGLGYARATARAGDLIIYKEHLADGSYDSRVARVIGRITECDSDGSDGKGMLLVLALTDTLTFGYERWVRPADVIECQPAARAAHFMAWLFKATPEELHKYNRDDLETRQAASPPVEI